VTENGHALGIDFGTSNTVAVVRWADGRVRPLLFDGSPMMPSAIYVEAPGTVLVGREALHAARSRPEAFEPNPKRRIDEGSVLLGEREMSVPDLIAAVLRRVTDEAQRVLGQHADVVLTHPAAWGPRRRDLLVDAARRASLPPPALVDEPVAAATDFQQVHGSHLPVDSLALVYDFGAGTFDASVVRRTSEGFTVLAAEGLPDAGGLDVDAAIFAYLGAVYGNRRDGQWDRLERPSTTEERRARRLLWEDVRGAKEMLSRTSSSMISIPLIDEDVVLGREQLERLARPILDRTVAATLAAVRSAGADPREIAGVFLVGGSSRIPLAATVLHSALGVAPTVIEQPEMVVAEGGVRTLSPGGHATPPGGVRWVTPVRGVAQVPTSAPPASLPPASLPPASLPPASLPPAGLPPESDPPASPPSPSAPDRGKVRRNSAVVAAAAVAVIWALMVAEYRGGPALQFGLQVLITHPGYLMLPAQLLLVPYGLFPGRGVRAVGSGLLYGGLYAAGFALGFGAGLVPYPFVSSDQVLWDTIQAVLAVVGAVGSIAGGVGVLALGSTRIAVRPIDRLRRAVPVLAGLTLGFVALANAPFADSVFYSVFDSSERLGDAVRYTAFVVGGSLMVTLVALVTALVRGIRRHPEPDSGAPSNMGYHVATGAALLIGGTLAAYAGYLAFVVATS
jgi:hypothetical protein